MKWMVWLPALALLAPSPSWGGSTAPPSAAGVFHIHCVPCHGADGKGAKDHRVTGADLHGRAVQSLSDSELFDAIAYSAHHKQYAHAFVTREVLTPRDVQGLVRYLREMGGKKSQ